MVGAFWLVVLLADLLKWEFQQERRSGSWQGTILEQQRELRQLLESGTLYNHASVVIAAVFGGAAYVLLLRVAPHQNVVDAIWQFVALVIGALTGLAVVAFILLTERMGMRLYPPGGHPWRRMLLPVAGSLSVGYLLFRYFPYARGSGVPQTKAALFARDGRITLRTVLGKFFCTSATLASGIPLGREGPSVQVGAGLSSL